VADPITPGPNPNWPARSPIAYASASYLRGGACKRPCTLADFRLVQQSDILFSRRVG
jgi:hypothetical protein